MRLKLLIFPLALVVAVIIVITWVWPEGTTVRESYGELKKNQETLSSIKQKNQNILNLKSQLDQDQDKEKLVIGYLPLDRNEEEIVNGINYLASGASVGLVTVSVEQVKEKESAAVVDATGSKEALFKKGEAMGNASESADPYKLANLKYIKAKIVATGSYENVKRFVDQLYRMDLSNSVSLLNIYKGQKGAQGKSDDTSDSLTAEIEADFGYLPPSKGERVYTAAVFSQTKFDFSALEKLKSLISQAIPPVEAGEVGKNNPFIP